MERKGFSKIHEYKSKKSLRETREYRCLLSSTDAEAARAGTDRYTHTQDNYSNPRACAPRVYDASALVAAGYDIRRGWSMIHRRRWSPRNITYRRDPVGGRRGILLTPRPRRLVAANDHPPPRPRRLSPLMIIHRCDPVGDRRGISLTAAAPYDQLLPMEPVFHNYRGVTASPYLTCLTTGLTSLLASPIPTHAQVKKKISPSRKQDHVVR